MVLNLTLQPLPPHFVQEGAFDPPARVQCATHSRLTDPSGCPEAKAADVEALVALIADPCDRFEEAAGQLAGIDRGAPVTQALIEGDETWQALLTTERPQ
jgi:hypothetical protein